MMIWERVNKCFLSFVNVAHINVKNLYLHFVTIHNRLIILTTRCKSLVSSFISGVCIIFTNRNTLAALPWVLLIIRTDSAFSICGRSGHILACAGLLNFNTCIASDFSTSWLSCLPLDFILSTSLSPSSKMFSSTSSWIFRSTSSNIMLFWILPLLPKNFLCNPGNTKMYWRQLLTGD